MAVQQQGSSDYSWRKARIYMSELRKTSEENERGRSV
jgi:hypothetical protein